MDGDQVTQIGHLQYGDFLMGPGTPYRWKSLSGWDDLPGHDSGNIARAGGHGSHPGQLLAQERVIGLAELMVRATPATIGTAVGALSAATGLVDEELPLVLWLDERGPLMVRARAVRRLIPSVAGYRLGTITGGALEFEATDPLRYDTGEQVHTVTLPAHELNVANTGDASTHPVIEFRGPVTKPSVSNLNNDDVLEYDLVLGANDVLVVDTAAGRATLNGTSALWSVTARSIPEELFVLPKGASHLYYAGSGTPNPAATLRVKHRSAYW